MPIEFPCTNCTRQVRVPDGSEGKKCKCPECQTILKVPDIEVEAIEIKLEVPCPRCDFVLVCDPTLEGTRGLCPNCKFIFTIAPPGSTPKLEPETSLQMTFAFQCPHCQQLFEGKPGMEGRKGKCIHCKEVFEIKKYVDPSSLVVAKKTTDDMPISVATNPLNGDTPQPHPVVPMIPAVTAKPVKATPLKATPVKATPVKEHLTAPVVYEAVVPVENDVWQSSVPAPVSSTYRQPLNPYASSPSATAYAAPSAVGGSGDAVSVRNYHLSHESAIKGFGLLYAIGAGMYFVLAAMAITLAIVVFALSNTNGVSVGIVVLVCGTILLIFGGLSAIVSSGLYKLSDAGKIGGILFSILGLCAFPVGTAMGTYLLYLIFSEKGSVVFSPGYREAVRQTPHIRAYIPIFVWIILGLGALSIVLVGVLFVFALLGAR